VLGLLHNDIAHSIMYPIYVTPASPGDFELVREDRQAVQQIYGVCKVGRQRTATAWCLSVCLSVPHLNISNSSTRIARPCSRYTASAR